MLGETMLEWEGTTAMIEKRIISYVKALSLISQGCLGFIAIVWDTRAEHATIDSVLILFEYPKETNIGFA